MSLMYVDKLQRITCLFWFISNSSIILDTVPFPECDLPDTRIILIICHPFYFSIVINSL